MKASKLIEELQNAINEFGDIEVMTNSIYQEFSGDNYRDHIGEIQSCNESNGVFYIFD